MLATPRVPDPENPTGHPSRATKGDRIMPTTTHRTVPAGVLTALGAAGIAGVYTVGGRGWHLLASALLTAAMVGMDVWNARHRRTGGQP